MHQLFGAASMTKNQISDLIFFKGSDWLIPCHKNVLVQHLPPRRGRKMRRDVLNVIDCPFSAYHLAASFSESLDKQPLQQIIPMYSVNKKSL
jgi:hypothetical protein